MQSNGQSRLRALGAVSYAGIVRTRYSVVHTRSKLSTNESGLAASNRGAEFASI
jgi:hypothetical protein